MHDKVKKYYLSLTTQQLLKIVKGSVITVGPEAKEIAIEELKRRSNVN